MQPFQAVNAGFGTPNYTYTDYVLVKVTGAGTDPATATLNRYDWQSAYGVWYNDIRNQGIRLDCGSYLFEVGFDMNLNGTLEAAEVQQTCNVHVPRVDINGDYNRDDTPVDHTSEAVEVSFTNSYAWLFWSMRMIATATGRRITKKVETRPATTSTARTISMISLFSGSRG